MTKELPQFPLSYDDILGRINAIDAKAYGRSRNYLDGKVSYLSPYISRGIVSTKQVIDEVLKKHSNPYPIEKFIQECAWRDYWQHIWVHDPSRLDKDFKAPQHPVRNHQIPNLILNGTTGINAIDQAISQFYQCGYLHNHARMYIASLTCNIWMSHWKYPAKWMYYHLLDGDWASNALSWQWVAGTHSKKKILR